MYHIEAPYDQFDAPIKPQNVKDGYITIGAGYIIQTEADAIKYGFAGLPGMSFKGDLSSDDVDRLIKAQQKKYGTKNNPAILTKSQAEQLLSEDLKESRNLAKEAADKANKDPKTKTFTNNEIDALASMLYNGREKGTENTLFYQCLYETKEKALNIIREAVDNDWYSHRGLFRRRLMEFNIWGGL